MMRNLLIFAFLLFAGALSAQLSIEIDPPTIHGQGSVDEADIAVYVTITNTSDTQVDLLWTRHEVEKPDMWWTWICDLNACYAFDIGKAPSSRVNTLARGESMEFQVHAKAFGVAGFAQVNVDIYDASDTTNILGVVEATFEAGTSSTSDLESLADLRVYPNPTTDYFRIYQSEGVEYIELYNIVGKPVLNYRATPDGHYDVSDIPEGMYLVRLLDRSNAVLKTVRLSKS